MPSACEDIAASSLNNEYRGGKTATRCFIAAMSTVPA
jgi:hypothetical protein